ncbi:MAG TPA: hypothetical protein VLI69_03200 [Gammaproteobacteria bacterium]|nr:hypothetical protein [Gammaproteobacteria bacterium]HSW93618.1 hypothetical protein [Gammaproteobacteria bacterium]
MKSYFVVLCVLLSVLTGCASQGLKAPCDQYASFCGKKTKINHW